MELLVRGGSEGKSGNYPRVQSSGDGTPRPIAAINIELSLDLEHEYTMSRPAMTRDLRSNRKEQGKIASIFVADAPQGRLKTVEEGFPQRFPSSRRGPRSFTPFARIPTADGAASAAATLPRIVTAGGRAVVRGSTVSIAGVRVRVRNTLRKG